MDLEPETDQINSNLPFEETHPISEKAQSGATEMTTQEEMGKRLVKLLQKIEKQDKVIGDLRERLLVK